MYLCIPVQFDDRNLGLQNPLKSLRVIVLLEVRKYASTTLYKEKFIHNDICCLLSWCFFNVKFHQQISSLDHFNAILPLNFVIEILDVLYFDQAIQFEHFDSIVIGDDAHKVPAECGFFLSPPSVIVAGLWIPIEAQRVTGCTINIEFIKIDAEGSFGWI